MVAEPTHAGGDHAAFNGAVLAAVAAERGSVLFAATARQHAALAEAADGAAPAAARCEIAVPPPGGVHLRRMRAQWRALSGLVRAHAPRELLLLSAGPETLFVARALAARHRRLRIFAVMHGNLADVVGWRSRDPRRRLIDLRAGLALARHPRVRLILLEPHIREAARGAGLMHDFLVWPHPAPMHEAPAPAPWRPGPRLRIAFVGSGKAEKGFDDFLALRRAAGAEHAWSLVGRLDEGYRAEAVAGIAVPDGTLSRAAFLAGIREADYAFVVLGPEYAFIASGSLLDCVAQRKPLLAVESPMLRALVRCYGPIGHLGADLDALRALLRDGAALRDEAAYAGFQRNLAAIGRDRGPDALRALVRRDLGG